MVQIPDLVENLAMICLAAGIEKLDRSLLLEEFFKKIRVSFQAVTDLFEHILTLPGSDGQYTILYDSMNKNE